VRYLSPIGNKYRIQHDLEIEYFWLGVSMWIKAMPSLFALLNIPHIPKCVFCVWHKPCIISNSVKTMVHLSIPFLLRKKAGTAQLNKKSSHRANFLHI
jgi:hypothetical protein